jgi:hypothetical protein
VLLFDSTKASKGSIYLPSCLLVTVFLEEGDDDVSVGRYETRKGVLVLLLEKAYKIFLTHKMYKNILDTLCSLANEDFESRYEVKSFAVNVILVLEGVTPSHFVGPNCLSEEILSLLPNNLSMTRLKEGPHVLYLKKNEDKIKVILEDENNPCVKLGRVLGYDYVCEDYHRPYDYYRVAFFLSDDSCGIYAFKIPAEKYDDSYRVKADKKLKEMNETLEKYGLVATVAIEYVD